MPLAYWFNRLYWFWQKHSGKSFVEGDVQPVSRTSKRWTARRNRYRLRCPGTSVLWTWHLNIQQSELTCMILHFNPKVGSIVWRWDCCSWRENWQKSPGEYCFSKLCASIVYTTCIGEWLQWLDEKADNFAVARHAASDRATAQPKPTTNHVYWSCCVVTSWLARCLWQSQVYDAVLQMIIWQVVLIQCPEALLVERLKQRGLSEVSRDEQNDWHTVSRMQSECVLKCSISTHPLLT